MRVGHLSVCECRLVVHEEMGWGEGIHLHNPNKFSNGHMLFYFVSCIPSSNRVWLLMLIVMH